MKQKAILYRGGYMLYRSMWILSDQIPFLFVSERTEISKFLGVK